MTTPTVLLLAEREGQIPSMLPLVESLGTSTPTCVAFGENEQPVSWLPEDLVSFVQGTAAEKRTDVVMLLATRLGKEIAPRLAVALDAGYVEGVISIEAGDGADLLFSRLTLGGRTIERVKITAPRKVITVVAANQRTLESTTSRDLRIERIAPRPSGIASKKKLLEKRPKVVKENIQDAERIVAVGRGIRKKEDVSMIDELAKTLDAKVASSRPLVEDLNWYTKDRQVGLSGSTVKPKLYIGIGISGQIQHIVGMRDSKVIVAINKDKTAPIFQYADYGVVGDLYQIVPELIKQLKR